MYCANKGNYQINSQMLTEHYVNNDINSEFSMLYICMGQYRSLRRWRNGVLLKITQSKETKHTASHSEYYI